MKIAIIGCGNMGAAFAKLLSAKNEVFLYDRHAAKVNELAHAGYGRACVDMLAAIQPAEKILLAIKPQDLRPLATTLNAYLKTDQVVISLLAGAVLETLKELFPFCRLVRMMPNLPILYGKGIIGVSATPQLEEVEKSLLTRTFEALGKLYWIPEEKMDALTSLSGSGPAFLMAMFEAMVDAGIAMGFSSQETVNIVHHMLQGSLTLLNESNKHPGELKWMIASPQGTTIAGLKKLEESALRGHIMNIFLAAYERSKQLASIS